MFFDHLLYIIKYKGAKMRENLLNRKDNNFKAAEKYALKYFNDLQKHFLLSDVQMIGIIKTSLNNFKNRENKKKWWQFF